MPHLGEFVAVYNDTKQRAQFNVRFLDALYYTLDGNFRSGQKAKPLDKDDVPLSKGAGYFADEDAFKAFTSAQGNLGPEVSRAVTAQPPMEAYS